MGANGTAVARRDIMGELQRDEARERIAQLVPEGVSVDRVIGAVALALSDPKTGPYLAKCTPASVVRAVARIAQWGLEVGTTAHLVPFGDTCTPVADYKGLAELMIATGAVRSVEARCVYEGDEFACEQGLEPVLRHVPVQGEQRGKLRGAYCILRLPFGRASFEYMSIEDIDAIRKQHSKQWNRGECPPWYARKTVVRQVAKLVPQNPRLKLALRVMEEDQTEEFGALPSGAGLRLLTPGAAVDDVDPMPQHPPVGARSRAVSTEGYGSDDAPVGRDTALANAGAILAGEPDPYALDEASDRAAREFDAAGSDDDDDAQSGLALDDAAPPQGRRRNAVAEGR